MLPIYVCYFAGENSEGKKYKTLINSIGFVLGFTIIFVLLGAFASTIGGALREYNKMLNIITGAIVVMFGLSFLGILKVPFFNGNRNFDIKTKNLRFFSSVLFGMIFSIGWTPCVGAFLGSALMLAGQQGAILPGVLLLLCFSAGLGVPFIISAILIEKLKSAFDVIKRNYKTINIISGGFLILIGILMMTGMMGYFLSLLTF
jgi:cytochrome c-type biogenesis protein